MTLRKWNYETKEYDDYEVNDSLKVGYYSDDFEEIINCASCEKPLKYGDSYTSKEIHTSVGFGYSVCEQCYGLEIYRWRQSEGAN